MSDFNYQEYLKNNPLLQKEVKENKLITEAEDKDVEEVMGIDRKGNKKPETDISDATKYKQAAKNVKEEEVTEGNLDDLRKLMDDLTNALAAFKKKAQELKLAVDSGNVTQTVNNYIEDVFKADYERTGGKIDESEEIQEEVPSSKMKVSELKAKIKEDILSILSEQDEEEDVEVDVEDEVDVEVDTEEPALDDVGGGDEGLSADEKEIQDSLKLAYDNAVAIGDTKLADQIGNSITFFTRTHVVER